MVVGKFSKKRRRSNDDVFEAQQQPDALSNKTTERLQEIVEKAKEERAH